VLEVFTGSSPKVKLGIITGFIALFFVLVAVATTARLFDALAAAAAYSAVLMVFLGTNS
jgi:preprotein translocase subunit SecD